jgi:hypothetical protein
MARISEKVRDIVEVRPYTTVNDFLREPETTLANYHFSDGTSYMMGHWLDAVGKTGAGDMCRAIAGHRGVGKSHFLAAFAVLLSHPELRSRVTDAHVLSSSQQLLRRHYTVVNVRRGLRASLLEEFAAAVCSAFDISEDKAGTTAPQLIETIFKKSAGVTPVLIIDSALERLAPIERNDGDVLAEIAEACKTSNVFVGLALDDDIAGADGSNAGVSASFQIEYLDPEHLYKVVNTNIFPKNPRTQSILGDLYNEFRSNITDFRWSEQRFSSLYPLHPATLELAPFIRSYLPRFALFGFAASAGEKILGRPADSLIGVEEVFDAVEFELRKVADLQGAFETYDRAAGQIAAEVPVSARHKAKLVLKVLLLNSLSQTGSSVTEIAAAMMVPENAEPGGSLRDIDAMLSGYAAAFPDAISADRDEDGKARYKFSIGSDEFAEEIDSLVETLPSSAVDGTFRTAVAERFPDLAAPLLGESGSADVFTVWRGSMRRGRVILETAEPSKQRYDWEVHLDLRGDEQKPEVSSSVAARIEWKSADLTTDERRSLAIYTILNADNDLRSKFAEQFSVAMIAARGAVAAAAERVMVTDARLVIDGFDYNFSESARAHSHLPEMIGAMLEPLFEAIYPAHPYFEHPLTQEIVSRFVGNLSESENGSAGRDEAALVFGVPLGIVEQNETGLSVVSKESLHVSPHVAALVESISESSQLDLLEVEALLGRSPVGLASEAVKLLLSAMALRGVVELVTADGERISGRSIDLKLDWSHISHVTAPRTFKASAENLLEWARLLTGEPKISSLSNSDDRTRIIESFVELSEQWERRNPFEAFEQVPDRELTTALWQHSSRTRDAYAAMISIINEGLTGGTSLEECLDRISTNFLDRPALFHDSRISVAAVGDFARSFPEVERIGQYLSLAEVTHDVDVEIARERMRIALRRAAETPGESENREVGYAWEKFSRLYGEHYAEVHSRSATTSDFRVFAEKVLGRVELNDPSLRSSVRAIRRKFTGLRCSFDPLPYLQTAPFCRCGFLLSHAGTLEEVADELRTLVKGRHPGQTPRPAIFHSPPSPDNILSIG